MLGPKIEALPDAHHYKPKCLSQLSQLLGEVGNFAEQKRLLTRTLELERQRGGDLQVAYTLRQLSDVNGNIHLYEEGIQQAEEALEIFKRTGNTSWQMQSSSDLAWLFIRDGQLDAAESVASHAINLVPEKDQELLVCRLHRVLGKIFQSKGERKKAVHHFETAIGIASPFNWHNTLFWNYCGLALLSRDEGEFDKANTHIDLAKSHAVHDTYNLGRAMQIQVDVWCRQFRLEEAKSEAQHALEIYERLGAAKDAGICRDLLQKVEQAMKTPTGSQGELLQTIPHPTSVNFHFLA
jgi:tetratricopeptide (TPR) repeat protein